MDWAEELKMSIRKTTARKGRRSKSRDVLKEEPSASTSGVTSPNMPGRDISIDITLDLNNGNNSATTTTTDMEKPPQLRRISGGWADSGFKGLKSKKGSGSFDDERFQFNRSASSTVPTDDIPVIPDLDDIKDDTLLNEIAEPSSVSVNRVVTLKELNSDLLSQNAFSAIEDVDLSILTRCLQPQDSLDEPDELWEWEKLFTEVTAEINADKPNPSVTTQKKEIGPDEIPPTASHNT